jgi:hypothetical protein
MLEKDPQFDLEEGLKKDLCCLKELGIDLDVITEKLQADVCYSF